MPTTETKTIKPAGGGDYSSLNAWDAAERANLVTGDKIKVAECYSGGNLVSAQYTMNTGWTTSHTQYVKITVASGHRHAGVYNTNKAYAMRSGSGEHTIAVLVRHCEIYDLQISNESTAGSAAALSSSHNVTGSDTTLICERSIIRGNGTSTQWAHISGRCGSVVPSRFVSCAIYNTNKTGDDGIALAVGTADAGTGTMNVYNCTIRATGATSMALTLRNFGGTTLTSQNNYLSGNTCYGQAGTSTYNKGANDACSNTEATTASLDNIAYSTTNFTNVTIGSENYHIKVGCALQNAGADLSGSGVTKDFDDESRGATTFDIGADEIPPPPVANFSGTPTAIITGTQVDFTDLSTNVPTTWAWAFGSGEGTSAVQNPSHTYNTVGDYTVSLDAANAGGTDNETKTNYIHVEVPIVADFSGTPTFIIQGTEVDFTDTSTGAPESWLWSFGTGEGTSMDQNPSHVYNTPGVYTVSLTASKTAPNSSDTETKVGYITVLSFIDADFSADDTDPIINVPVNFTDESTGDPDEWLWDFGDGDTSTDQNPSHAYDTLGTYTVTLTASHALDDDTETKIAYITVHPEPPVADFVADETDGLFPFMVNFTDLTTGVVDSWEWDFGDDTAHSFDQNPTHVFEEPGTYTVSLTSTNESGSDTETKTNYITAHVVTIVPITVDPDTGDYESLADLAADVQDLPSMFEAWEVSCDTFEETADVDFSGWVITDRCYLKISGTDNHESNGQPTGMAYSLVGNLSFTDITEDAFIYLSGLQVTGNVTTSDGSLLQVEKTLVTGDVSTSLPELFLINCIVRGNVTQLGAANVLVYSSTVLGTVDMADTGDSEVFNTYAGSLQGLTGILVVTSATTDGTGSPGLTDMPQDDGITFISTDDLRPSSGSQLLNNGTLRDGFDPPFDYEEDFDGRTRPDLVSDLEDIGAIEFSVEIGTWPEDIWLVERLEAVTTTDDVDAVLLSADSAEVAEELMRARRPGEGWVGSGVLQGMPAGASGWWGWTFRVSYTYDNPSPAQPDRRTTKTAVHIGTEGENLDSVLEALSGLIPGSTFSALQRKLVIVPTGKGDAFVKAEVIPPTCDDSLDAMIQRIDHLGEPEDALDVVFTRVFRIPYIIRELK